jgi:hypothetical protein
MKILNVLYIFEKQRKKIPKSKKGNENWTFIKCPDFGTQIKFQKTLFFHIVTNMM